MGSKSLIDREKTAPFLMRAFVKIGSYHRPESFRDGTLPTTDEYQIYAWKDATLKEVLTSLRVLTDSPEIRHPLAKVGFRALYADSSARGRLATRDLGTVYSRDILGEPGTLDAPAPRLLTDSEEENDATKTLEELRFEPGDYLCVSVLAPKHVIAGPDVLIRGAATAPGVALANGWKKSRALSPAGPPGGLGRGGGHWRGGSEPGAGRGRGGRDERSRRDLDRDLERDRRVPSPRRVRDSPPHRNMYAGRDARYGQRSRSRSRSPIRRHYR